TIRDSGSANGVFVNGKKTERARLRDGDVVKLGDVVLTALPKEAGTVVMEDDFDGLGARRPSAPDAEATTPDLPESLAPPAEPRRPLTGSFRPVTELRVETPGEGPGTFRGSGPPRPLTVTVLAVLWGLSVP